VNFNANNDSESESESESDYGKATADDLAAAAEMCGLVSLRGVFGEAVIICTFVNKLHRGSFVNVRTRLLIFAFMLHSELTFCKTDKKVRTFYSEFSIQENPGCKFTKLS
jgi:hypothetical protein